MSKNQQDEKTTSKQHDEISVLASVAQLSLIILTVVYSSDPSDLWDVAIAVFVIIFGYRYRVALWGNSMARYLAIAGVAVSVFIIFQTVLMIFNQWTPYITWITQFFVELNLNSDLTTAFAESAAELLWVIIFAVALHFLMAQARDKTIVDRRRTTVNRKPKKK